MGAIGRKLSQQLVRKAEQWSIGPARRRASRTLPGQIKDLRALIREGYDPIHAAYFFMLQISSFFAESVSSFPAMKPFVRRVSEAEQAYMPEGLPVSPLTQSYFTSWLLYDLRFGDDEDTLGECQIDANTILRLNPDQLVALRNLCESRMGIYELVEVLAEKRVQLRELVSNHVFNCLSPSGYTGQPGELWFVRRLPPLLPEVSTDHILLTTPYVLVESTREDWKQYLKRTLVKVEGPATKRLYRLLKFGLESNYWNEFIYSAYLHEQPDAVFLAGVPDLRATLPNGD